MRRGIIMLIGLAALAAPAMAASDPTGPTVRVDGGTLVGTQDDREPGIRLFRGIPYAATPVGDLRWREPQPPARWTGTRPATAYGPRCMQQPLYADMMFRSPAPSEDCLFLNVWAPATTATTTQQPAAATKLPVLVYIHGGGFRAGDGSERRYDGAAMAKRGIVVVTLNYRLGVFGFLAHPALTARSTHRTSGNYGLLDQVAALHWVRRNIAAFGGDPARITIAGESAGSMSVSALMASPLSRNDIAGAIGESGAVLHALTPPPLADAERSGTAFAQAAGAPTLAALLALPADTLLAAQGKAQGWQTSTVIDGHFLTEPPAATFAAGRAARVPLLVGSNSQEAPAAALLGDAAPTIASYRAALTRRFADKADRLFALYPAATDAAVLPAATTLVSDGFLALPTWKWFDLHRRTGAPTYYYYYTRVRPRAVADPVDAPPAWGAVHSAEIEYALGNLDANPLYAWEPEDRTVSTTLSGYFANFIRTGNPNGPALPVWPPAPATGETLRRQTIDVVTRDTPFPEQARYRAAEPLLLAR